MEEKKEVFKRKYYNKTDSGIAFMLCNIIPLALMFVVLFAIKWSGQDIKLLQGELWYLVVTALLSQVSFLLVAFLLHKFNKIEFSATKISFKLDWKILLICVGVAVVCFFGLYNFIDIFGYLFQSIGYKFEGASLPLNSPTDLVLNLLLLALLPAIGEELVFRGIIFSGLKSAKGKAFAVVGSSLLFALMHGNLAQFVYPFIMGLVFSMVVLRTGNLLYSMIVHFVNNALVIVFSYVNISLSIGNTILGILLGVVIAAIVFGILFLVDKFVFKHKSKQEEQEKVEDNGSNVFMYIGIAIAGIMLLSNLVTSF